MKTIIMLILVMSVFTSYAQWQPDVRLTNNPSASSKPSISVSGEVMHVTWCDDRDGNFEIYYKRSIDAGLSWGADTRLTNYSGESYEPSISVSGEVIHVTWYDYRNGGNNPEIYYKRSTDGGVSWGTDIRLTNFPGNSLLPIVAVSNQVVHIVWLDVRDGYYAEIYYKRSPDEGVSWGTDIRLTNDSAESLYPSVVVSGSVVHLVWEDDRDGNQEIYYKRSTDGGLVWEADTRLTMNSASSGYPSVTVSGSVVHVVWNDLRDGNQELYYNRSIDGGVSWGSDTRVTNNAGSSMQPSITVSGSVVHVVWEDYRNGSNNPEIYYKRSTDGGLVWEADTRLTNATGNSWIPSLSVSDQIVHVVWYDNRNGNYEIYYKRNPTGNPIGIINISSEVPSSYSLKQNHPNPFNPSTNIEFDVPKQSLTKIVVFDILGRETAVLVNEELKAGSYKIDFEGSRLTSGIYFYQIQSGDYSETKKMILLK